MARRDNIELVWNIAELSSLFERRTNVDGFLEDVVNRVADHLESDVCSIYLIDGTGRLVLRATRGLDPGSVGTVSLALGEGITGTAVKELRPIRAGSASRNPNFKLIPRTGEERYMSLLAVPIRRGLNRIGALVVQHRRADAFSREDTRALQAIAGQLAATLENAELMMELHHAPESDRHDVPPALRFTCQRASDGIAIGRVRRFDSDGLLGERSALPASDGGDQEEVFLSAVRRTEEQLETIHQELEERLSDMAGLIFGSHLLMLRDEEFSGRMLAAVREGRSAEDAVRTVVRDYVELLGASANARTREMTHDVRDLGSRLLRNLGDESDATGELAGRVAVADELLPSELVRLAAERAEGVILTGGGATAHLTILARSLELPAVIIRDHLDAVPEDELVVVDGTEGVIHVAPGEAVLARYQAARAAHRVERAAVPRGPALTADGTAIELLANVNILHDAEVAVRAGAQGIGLYRSEFPFLVRNDFPSEEEQYQIYRSVMERVPDGPMVLRTLDVGGDKLMNEEQGREANPFLGQRGIRFSLAHAELFEDQLRAMLRAGEGRDLRILLPMVSSVDELDRTRELIGRILRDLAEEGLPHHPTPGVGVMIEVPSAVECVEDFARRSDFLSIGSNDLVMYMLAVDRANEQVEPLYRPLHPAILRALARVMDAGRRHGCPVSICGEAGAAPAMLRFLVGIGLRTVSADPLRLSRVRDRAASFTVAEAESFARSMLAADSIVGVEKVVRAEGLA